MGIYGLIANFAVLYVLAKLVGGRHLKFYTAGPLYAIASFLLGAGIVALAQLSVNGVAPGFWGGFVQNWPHLLLVAIAATVFFWLLDRYDETIAAWLVIFVTGFFVLSFII